MKRITFDRKFTVKLGRITQFQAKLALRAGIVEGDQLADE